MCGNQAYIAAHDLLRDVAYRHHCLHEDHVALCRVSVCCDNYPHMLSSNASKQHTVAYPHHTNFCCTEHSQTRLDHLGRNVWWVAPHGSQGQVTTQVTRWALAPRSANVEAGVQTLVRTIAAVRSVRLGRSGWSLHATLMCYTKITFTRF